MRRLVLAALALAAVAGCGADEPQSPPASPSGALPPVLLVHGYGGSAGDMARLASALEAAGRDARPVNLDPAWGDWDDQVARLDAAAGDDAEVDVVGFSAGGLVARLWAVGDGAEVARRVVTVATPNQGTDPAVLGSACTGTCADLLAGSDLLDDLNDREPPTGPDWVAVWSEDDGVVVPAESARLEGALDVRLQDVCPGVAAAHLDLLGPPATAIVVAVLDGDAPAAPDDSSCASE
ncbi:MULTISPECIES: lipase family alpha/beta hydrolase [unclassified Nocardioides]|uniref:lipase family alpha/beta hydrolase n=1 Tax=unclassified Nocardioides TaxID=2615069 RepID=UPI00361284AA